MLEMKFETIPPRPWEKAKTKRTSRKKSRDRSSKRNSRDMQRPLQQEEEDRPRRQEDEQRPLLLSVHRTSSSSVEECKCIEFGQACSQRDTSQG